MIRYDYVATRVGRNGGLPATRARDLFTEVICYCFESTRLSEAAALIIENHVSILPVVTAAGDLVGILTREDIPQEALTADD